MLPALRKFWGLPPDVLQLIATSVQLRSISTQFASPYDVSKLELEHNPELESLAPPSASTVAPKPREADLRSKNDGQQDVSPQVRRAAALEIKWLKDPAQLTRRVADLLKTGNEPLAMHLTRLGSKRQKSATVPWNLLINHFMSQDPPRTNFSLKLYNEMKKRNQMPDGYTFSMLLRGLYNHKNPGVALLKAKTVYKSMLAPRSPVAPSEIHVNYMLQLCAKAKDMQSLWEVVQTIPEDGPTAASTTTYTVIFQAIRAHAVNARDAEQQDISESCESSVEIGRRIWRDVVSKWREGIITLDSKLVASMARLLLVSPKPEDWDDVLSLVEQTTGIPRQSPPIRSPGLTESLPSEEDDSDNEYYGIRESQGLVPQPFAPIVASSTATKPGSLGVQLVRPSNHILTVLLETCLQLKAPKAVSSGYWDIITDSKSFDIRPDLESVKSYLRILRMKKSSRDAVDAVRTLAKRIKPDWGCYRIAMSACRRNLHSQNAIHEATELYHLRSRTIKIQDVTFLESFLAIVEGSQNREQQVDGLQSIGTGFMELVAMQDQNRSFEEQRALGLAKRLIGAFDKVINTEKLSNKDFAETKKQLSNYVFQRNHVET